MKVVFISNFLSHHQIPFSNEMYKLLRSDYHFISTAPMDDERKKLGWGVNSNYPYEIKSYESAGLMEEAMQLVNESDVVIIGSAPDSFIVQRIKNRKLTFKYSERLYKEGLSLKSFPRAIISSYIHHGRFQKYPMYLLCASAYTASDLSIFGNYKGKMYKWGYFPEFIEYNIEKLIKNKRGNTVKILWAGRFIDWKHPEFALSVAQKLNNENIDFTLEMIGIGEELEKIKCIADNMNLKNPIEFLGPMNPNEVRKHMDKANIFIFTSDFKEGWGAVLNESMNSGCAVVSSHAIGATPFLVKNNDNGLIFKNGDVENLCKKVILLSKNVKLREKLGKNAYLTIKETWNAKVATERFIKLSENLLRGNIYDYKYGPCSRATIIKNTWFSGGYYDYKRD